MERQKFNEFGGFGMALTFDGPIFYFFNTNKTTMKDFLKLEYLSIISAKKNQYHLFELHNIDSIGDVVISYN